MSQNSSSNDALEQLALAFKCAKCRGDKAHVQSVRIPTGEIPKIFKRPPGRYVFVTCALCGYTEVYDLAVIAAERERASAEAASASQA